MQTIESRARLEIAYQFALQAAKLGFSILERPGNYVFKLQDRVTEKELQAAVMAASFDFYEYRLNRAKKRADLLIVQEHNALLPLPALCLADGHLYDPGVMPGRWQERKSRQRRNRAESQMFVSRLLLSDQGALQELASMPERTRQYYQAKMKTYLSAKRGRPWSS